MKLVRDLLRIELEEFDKQYLASLKSNVGILDKVVNYVSLQKGKQLRPILVLLSARISGGIRPSSFRAACLVEYLHTATLVHDDVVDESFVRRGKYSIKALWGGKMAVILGDYMLAKGLLLSLDHDDFGSLKILSTAVQKMAEAEMLQFEKNAYRSMDEKSYYEIIRGKTASLFASACGMGAWSVDQNHKLKNTLSSIGENLGMAFQIKDDIADYDSLSKTGKPQWKDLKSKKATLPFLYALQQASEKNKQKVLSIFEHRELSSQEVREIVDIIVDIGGIDYASKIMMNYASQAMEGLKQFPEGIDRLAFEDLIQYSIHRTIS